MSATVRFNQAIVRDLPREEILLRRFPLTWWGEFQKPMGFYCSRIGRIEIPAGFFTDGASIPRIAWALLSDTDPDILYPSYAHDYLYARRGQVGGQTFSKETCDLVLMEAMQAIGAPAFKCQAVYRAVRMFGGHAWDNQPVAKVASASTENGTYGTYGTNGTYDKEMQ